MIIGNPPYVGYNKVKKDYSIINYHSEACGDLFAFIVERSVHLAHKGGRTGLIVRLSSMSNPSMITLREVLLAKNHLIYLSSYSASAQPACLFEGVRDRLCIYLIKLNNECQKIYTSNFLKWFSDERPFLFNSIIEYYIVDDIDTNFIPKIGNKVAQNIYYHMQKFKKISSFLNKKGKYIIYYHESPVHWHKAWPFVPYYCLEGEGLKRSVSIRELRFELESDTLVILCVGNSSLFYWYYNTVSDCRHLTMETYSRLPVGLDNINKQVKFHLRHLSRRLVKSYEVNKQRYERTSKKTGKSEFDAYYPAKSKDILDEIDRVLAKHYGFTEEELDFIINYDIKYRMGLQ